MVKYLAVFVLGVVVTVICAVGAAFGWEQLKSAAPHRMIYASASTRTGAEPTCRGSVLDVDRPNGIVVTPAQAEMVFRSSFPDRKFVRSKVRVSDRGDVWLVEQTLPAGSKGEGYSVDISKCDATVTLLRLPQE